MQVKTFTGRDAKSVLAQIKQELGPDAVILSKHEGCGGDGKWCEMTAGLERPMTPSGGFGSALSEAAKVSQGGADTYAPANGNGAGTMPPAGWSEWHKEWSEIKEHIVALMKPGMTLEELSPRQRVALEYLEREGVDDGVLLTLFRRLKKNPGDSVLLPLSDMVAVRGWSHLEWSGRYHAFCGPFGAGKTSAVIRMALALRKRDPNIRICLINADSERGNGRLLLRHYAELSDMGYKEASGPIEFAMALRESQEFDKVLIDLPGLGRDGIFADLESSLGLEAAEGLCVHRVLSPSYSSVQLSKFLRQYSTPRSGSIIWTKLDEACTFGAVVNVAVSSGLPVSALSFGPGLNNTLVAARDVMLWRLVFKHQLPSEINGHNSDAVM